LMMSNSNKPRWAHSVGVRDAFNELMGKLHR
jgi:hypothetical protein